MRFSVAIPGLTLFPGLGGQPEWARHLEPDDIREIAARADELGFDQIAVPWHLAIRHGEWERNMGPRWPHSLTTAAYLSGATQRIQILTLVVAPCCQPIELAKSIATLDWLAGGERLVPVLLAGYLDWEFELLGVPYERRDDILDEYVDVLRLLWTQDVASFDGEFVKFDEVMCEPKPRRAPLPLWFGGRGKRALRRVAKHGAGWMSYAMTHAGHVPALDYIRSRPEFEAAPRDLDVAAYFVEPTHDPYTHEELAPPVPVIGTEAVLERVAHLAALGVTSTGAAVSSRAGDGPARSLSHYLEQLDWFAAEILPEAHRIGTGP